MIRFENNSSHTDIAVDEEVSTIQKGKENLSIKRRLTIVGICFICLILIIVLFKLYSPSKTTSEANILTEISLPEICSNKQWRPKVYLNCTGVGGGTFNTFNGLMSCLRLSIDAGIGMTAPALITRSPQNLKVFTGEKKPFEWMFDFDSMKAYMQDRCQNFIFVKSEDLANNIKHINNPCHENPSYSYGKYSDYIDQLLENNGTGEPVVIEEPCPAFVWKFALPEEKLIHRDLLYAVKFNRKLMSIYSQLKEALRRGEYIGVHFRVESDAPWQSSDEQLDFFMQTYEKTYTNIKRIYIATGDLSAEANFRKTVSEKYGCEVVSKNALLPPESLTGLEFDQVAVIDAQALINSTAFFGIGLSSFSFGVAALRGEKPNHILGQYDWHFTNYF